MRNNLILLLCLGLFVTTGCDVTKINVDPTRVSEAALRQQLPIALLQTAKNQWGTPGRASAGFVQYFSGSGCWPNYYIPPATTNNYWRDGVYAGALKDANNIVIQATEEEQPYYRAIARIIMAENYGMLASMFGEVPFSEALAGNDQLQPAYDPQDVVYAGVQELLDQAIVDLNMPEVEAGPAEDDLIYNGDAEAWIACAYALKARYAMHLSRRDDNAGVKALEWISKSFTDLSQQANFQWNKAEGAENPLAAYGITRPNTMAVDERFHDSLVNHADPRIDYYLISNGWEHQFFDPNNPLRWSESNAAIPVIAYAELLFLKAEALLYTNAPMAQVEETLKMAIRANMEDIGVPGTDAETYINQRADLSNFDYDQTLSRIIEEAYYAYFGYAPQQAWTNWRRTGYPELEPDNGGYSAFNPNGVIPVRFLYPDIEQTTNYTNWQAASMRQGGALLSSDTWAFADY